MTAIEVARKLADYEQTKDAQNAYILALQQGTCTPEEMLEAADYIFFSQGDYRVAYTTYVSLYSQGHFRERVLDLMNQAFYQPNQKKQRRRYRDNVERLSRYPYLFRKDFPDFDQLSIRFFPFDDNGYLPFDCATAVFGDYVNWNDPVIDRNFFSDLENPILAQDVYSQYQLNYLHDNVRKSEWVGRENHIYLHYTSWETFCAHLQCLELADLLRDRKLVFLFGEEIAQYPIDFQARFGIDYSKYSVRPLNVHEVKRLIWHTQLSSHNGGDFFNEIFHNHPNLITTESMMFDRYPELLDNFRRQVRKGLRTGKTLPPQLAGIDLNDDKEVLVGMLLGNESSCRGLDPASRIVPAVFLQPHFSNIHFDLSVDARGNSTLYCKEYEPIRNSPMFQAFSYIKTFTPMRRPTTSYGATVRFMLNKDAQKADNLVLPDVITERLLNRSFMVDPQDRLYHDSVLVRFEDGKLNPRATFTALAAFLDIPYTESMTYCSGASGLNPESYKGNDLGFDPAAIYRTYDEYTNDDERAFLEYFFRDTYQCYGYEFLYYDGEQVDLNWVKERVRNFTKINGFMEEKWSNRLRQTEEGESPLPEEVVTEKVRDVLANQTAKRIQAAELLMRGLHFINENNQPLHFMKKLELDPALLEQPLYH